MRRLLCLAVAVAAATSACGAPEELSRENGRELELARDRIVAAIELNERLGASGAAADRLLARVREFVATGALEPEQLDEFGLASLGELRLVAPSLVIVDRLEVPRELDREALRALLENGTDDVDAATRIPAEKEVDRIGELLSETDAAGETSIPVVEQSVDGYLSHLRARLRPLWPRLAARLAD